MSVHAEKEWRVGTEPGGLQPLFERVKNWDRWGAYNKRGAGFPLNSIAHF